MARLVLSEVDRIYPGEVPVHALVDVSLTIEQGEYIAIEGPSGSGKSTLLNQLALLDTPTNGSYTVDDVGTTTLNDAARARLRSDTFAFIFQSFHLLDGRTVLDNVALGTLYLGLPARARRERAHEALAFVGLDRKEWQRTSRLSGGERQRVAIARAVASGAPVVVADEPTGNLDRATGQQIMETLERIHSLGTTIIIVTHDPDVAARAHRRLHVLDGQVTQSTQAPADSDTADLTAPVAAPMPAGRSSRVRLADGLGDAWKGLWSKTSRTLALVASVALGVGLALTTAGLSVTAQYQVSGIFDAQRNQRVSMTTNLDDAPEALAAQVLSEDSLARVHGLAGVEAAAVFVSHGQTTVSPRPHASAEDRTRDVVGLVAGRVPSKVLAVDTQGDPVTELGPGEALVGLQAAQEMSLGPLLASPAVWVNGTPRRVVGVLTDSGLQVGLLSAVLVPEQDAAALAAPQWASAELKVASGAAAQVAGQAPWPGYRQTPPV